MTTAPDGALHVLPDGTLELVSHAVRRQRIVHSTDLFATGNRTLADAIGDRRPLVIYTPAVERWYGDRLHRYLTEYCPHGFDAMLLDRAEHSKTLSAVEMICKRAAEAGLRRTSPMVAIGGGICTDLVGLAAAVFRRGVPHLKVPTTLIGLVDAGIGTKNAVNHAGRKSLVGTFYPPEMTILDPAFIRSLPRRHVANGMAEVAKLATVTDAYLFEVLERSGATLVRTQLGQPQADAIAVIERAVHGMLDELAGNLYEHVYQRAMDFGHTFSPYFETASRHTVLHGEAVAMDIALSAALAAEIGILAPSDRDRILGCLRALGLESTWPGTDCHALRDSLTAVREHRDGALNLCLPVGIGAHTFIGQHDFDLTILKRAHAWLQPGQLVARRPTADVRALS
jgi:2-epi-5-epi-valiolone synthase